MLCDSNIIKISCIFHLHILFTVVISSKLDYKVTTEQVSELFRIAGNVINVELKLDKENKPRGMALVRYDHPVEALQAICIFYVFLLDFILPVSL